MAVHEDGAPLRPESYTDEFQRLRARAGLRRIKLHGLRNTSVSAHARPGPPAAHRRGLARPRPGGGAVDLLRRQGRRAARGGRVAVRVTLLDVRQQLAGDTFSPRPGSETPVRADLAKCDGIDRAALGDRLAAEVDVIVAGATT